jgi:hypothetical protein
MRNDKNFLRNDKKIGFVLKKHENCRKFQNQQELCPKKES